MGASPLWVAVALAVGAPNLKTPPPQAPTLVGDWVIESMVFDGKAWAFPPGGVWQFRAGGRMVDRGPGEERAGTYTADAQKDPAEIELGLIGPGWELPGIFRIDGDTLTICHVFGKEQPRPRKFESQAGSFHMLVTLKRAKKD